MSDAIAINPGPFQRRAGKMVSNAGLYQLVEDLAAAHDRLELKVDAMQEKIDDIHGMCVKMLGKLSDDRDV